MRGVQSLCACLPGRRVHHDERSRDREARDVLERSDAPDAARSWRGIHAVTVGERVKSWLPGWTAVSAVPARDARRTTLQIPRTTRNHKAREVAEPPVPQAPREFQ